jgi:hypothetical protein
MAKLSYQIANGNMSRMELVWWMGLVEYECRAADWGGELKRGWREIRIPLSPAGYPNN